MKRTTRPVPLRAVPLRAASAVAAFAAGALLLSACGGTATGTPAGPASSGGAATGAASGDAQVTIYSADGLADWYKGTFEDFTKSTGIKVNYVESGSGEVVSRTEKEKSNPQADILVTLPPFIQQADQKGLLGSISADLSAIPPADKAADGHYVALVNNYFAMIRGTAASPKPDTWKDLLDAGYKGKVQYSTPGQAGDGTAMMVLLEQILGKQGAMDYFKALQPNNVGPSSSTGKLGPKVSKGELSAANSDVQMALQSISADKSAYEVFFPKTDDGKRSTVSLPYDMGLASNAPHKANAEKLMAYLLSKDVQSTVSSKAFGLPVRSDVTPSDANFATLKKTMDGVTVANPDWDAVQKGLKDDLAAYNAATGQ
ncbi:2-aminoethylphosphonate ABC transporter substrate-binding protein [Sinomonas sp. ASV322]|uniref:2-aminoethylphosphonate ABC transporter substrate-binding protein n=1 Tax=Sinomonas sp. ASV322 TaxID=3041920 RepID=UPI0027DE2985|nr:2-aminoethylphosphonate ABC transporter substrate-binding protein [Sinomonas sp. ASV322]MDQ4502604.1 2-aminoethylphosphonate ABC transporter substrate-binding protein [Sinomonas sp. ASV322]